MSVPSNAGKKLRQELDYDKGKSLRKWVDEEKAVLHTLGILLTKKEQETCATAKSGEEISVSSFVLRDVLKLSRDPNFTPKHITLNRSGQIIGVLGKVKKVYKVREF